MAFPIPGSGSSPSTAVTVLFSTPTSFVMLVVMITCLSFRTVVLVAYLGN